MNAKETVSEGVGPGTAWHQGPYWISVATNGEHQVCGRNGKILFRYPPHMISAADGHCKRLQDGYKRAERHLFAAAPAMFEALEKALDALEKLDAGKTKVAGEARAALAAARCAQ